jgi:hypothetical protein
LALRKVIRLGLSIEHLLSACTRFRKETETIERNTLICDWREPHHHKRSLPKPARTFVPSGQESWQAVPAFPLFCNGERQRLDFLLVVLVSRRHWHLI